MKKLIYFQQKSKFRVLNKKIWVSRFSTKKSKFQDFEQQLKISNFKPKIKFRDFEQKITIARFAIEKSKFREFQ